MKLKKSLAVLAALCVPTAPAVALTANAGGTPAQSTTTKTAPSPVATKAAKARAAAKRQAVRRNVRLARIHAKRTGTTLSKGYASRAKARRTSELRRSNQRLRAKLDRLRARASLVSRYRSTLRAIARCESHGNPRAVSSTGMYRGLFQFSLSTWRSVGGSGDPARASVAEQYYRAALLYRRAGSSPWPVCGR